MNALQNITDALKHELKVSEMYLRFETNNRDYEKATYWLARQIKFLRLIDLLITIQAYKNNNEYSFKITKVMEGLQAELLNCRELKYLAVQNQQFENCASLRDEEKKFAELIMVLNELEF